MKWTTDDHSLLLVCICWPWVLFVRSQRSSPVDLKHILSTQLLIVLSCCTVRVCSWKDSIDAVVMKDKTNSLSIAKGIDCCQRSSFQFLSLSSISCNESLSNSTVVGIIALPIICFTFLPFICTSSLQWSFLSCYVCYSFEWLLLFSCFEWWIQIQIIYDCVGFRSPLKNRTFETSSKVF